MIDGRLVTPDLDRLLRHNAAAAPVAGRPCVGCACLRARTQPDHGQHCDLSGFLLANLFRESFKQFQRDTKIAIDSEYRFNSSQYQDLNYQMTSLDH